MGREGGGSVKIGVDRGEKWDENGRKIDIVLLLWLLLTGSKKVLSFPIKK